MGLFSNFRCNDFDKNGKGLLCGNPTERRENLKLNLSEGLQDRKKYNTSNIDTVNDFLLSAIEHPTEFHKIPLVFSRFPLMSFQKNPCAHKNTIGIPPPPPQKESNTPPPQTRNFMGMDVFLQKECNFSRRP